MSPNNRHKIVQDSMMLDKLMAKTEGKVHSPSIRLSDGRDLVNLLLGKQDVGFLNSRVTLRQKQENSKQLISQNIIQEHLDEESSNDSLCTSESLANSSSSDFDVNDPISSHSNLKVEVAELEKSEKSEQNEKDAELTGNS